MDKLKTIILAAGAGSRMKSDLAKVLHKASGKALVEHVLDASKAAESDEIAVIVGNQKEDVIAILPDEVKYYVQEELNGTGHAVMQARDFFSNDESDIVLVLNGDSPLIRPETIKELIEIHRNSGNSATVLTAELDNPTGYGRIITENGELKRIVEERDANDSEKAIKEVNSGVYCFNSGILDNALNFLSSDNNQKEYYLTDTIEIIKNLNKRVGTYKIKDSDELGAVNSRKQLAEVEKIFRKITNDKLMDSGVTLIDPDTTYIDSTVKIGKDTIVYPGNFIEGNTIIGSNCIIGLNNHIKDSIIKDFVEIQSSTIMDSSIDEYTKVGPYAYLRPNSQIGKDVKIGDFVEVKNSKIGNHSKASHLTYIGDAEVGENVNLGCGTVFVNYDGKNKNKVIVEDNCFIGCNTNLVAPVTVKEGSYTAAGSTITNDVPKDTLSIARARQINKVDYFNKKKQ